MLISTTETPVDQPLSSGMLGFGGHIFEVQVAFVEVEPVGSLVGGEEQVDLAIVVEIAGAYAAAVVVIHVIEYVEVAGGVEGIAEIQAGPVVIQHFEGGVLSCRSRCLQAGKRARSLASERRSQGYWVTSYNAGNSSF